MPLVVSVDGVIGKEGRSLLKQFSLHLADKWKKPLSVVAGIVRSRISIAMLRASNYCIRGSRTSFTKLVERFNGTAVAVQPSMKSLNKFSSQIRHFRLS